jgi:L-alanine-DL-glutamate epimerase-like enolase superfamily enzyme
MPTDALRFARAIEKYNVMWCEDMLTGDYSTHQNPQIYRDLTMQTTTPIHTGEQVYLRNNFKELIETQAVNIVGPDPADVGGIAELKWIAEYAHLHGILMAPHGTGNGVLGLAALIQVCATLPANYIAFEYPTGTDPWWYEIVEGLPKQIVKNSMIDVIDRPGMGVDLIPEAAQKYLAPEDADFFR